MKKTSRYRVWAEWLSTAGLLAGVQILLVIFDRMGWSPKLRYDSSFLMRIRDSIMESTWFIDIFNFYTADIYNLITFLSVVIIVLQTIFLLCSRVFKSE
ncbi:YfzA family protein [Oceanobacillus neutriphilus]|uniref:YfzA-like protein n=1 Tax=Oceanobacillus neutriphilus TaxID=531815 RepID=A0ABQ2NXJ5_9BACI|nr:YfzA family protein [Oceanobacillus neutriphilus]GGP13031.1 hypothetical protein GCM10011346_31380 [Oceanobacillus neutriphilus]